MKMINRREYPELDALLWDTTAETIPAQDALRIYEQRWGFVNQAALQNHERELIKQLAKAAGGFLPAVA
ncbi:hypothetical protein [Pseudidiomarina donghaiensis]|uniref:Uncharacterized protein n=1 Tax=Pseudidiomarina donghaiensis TaxID=519452 RepID=A0A432XMU3_9GAMM|nr:hypothetical protein [Pseudidiomarina donghaiensis]RUO50017.1 hypothetical protein CWE24_02000 [Pseudidiomarina donghaiensis]SFV20945.1 hypothetical protein SAMN04488139_0534 [Pseudidiomarina donghaiensis]